MPSGADGAPVPAPALARLNWSVYILEMTEDQKLPIYIDQNVLSGLQEDRAERQSLLDILEVMRRENCFLIYSDVHVQECRASSKPSVFADILAEISAYYFENAHDVSSLELTLKGANAHSLILRDRDVAEDAGKLLERIMTPIQFSMGWLSDSDERELKTEMVEEVEEFFATVRSELPTGFRSEIKDGERAVVDQIESLDWAKLSDDSMHAYGKLREKLPANLAQLDEVPANEVAAKVIAEFEGIERETIDEIYPQGFWCDPDKRQYGSLSGFAFMLFLMGVVRDRRVRKGAPQKRLQHLLGQWRDCQHIEIASRCQAFITFDKDAARLAKAVYAYSGTKTEVIHLVKV